jgi:hypothetical protein
MVGILSKDGQKMTVQGLKGRHEMNVRWMNEDLR